jgi:hypothetical protein
MRTLNILAGVLMLCCGSLPTVSFGSDVIYKIGEHKFSIPKKNIADLSPFYWINSLAGLDQNVDSFIFEFSGDEIMQNISAYIPRINSIDKKIIGLVYRVNQVEKIRHYDTDEYANIWYAINGYENREVSFDERSGYYFVYEKKGYRGLFYIFSTPPEGVLPATKDDFFVASCSGSSLTELRHVSCSKHFFIADDLVVRFSVSLENLVSIENAVLFIKTKFAEWRI